jgi:hypothetical protein
MQYISTWYSCGKFQHCGSWYCLKSFFTTIKTFEKYLMASSTKAFTYKCN